MRKLPVAAALSVVLHGGAVAWVHFIDPPPPPIERPRDLLTVEIVEYQPPAPAPEPEPELTPIDAEPPPVAPEARPIDRRRDRVAAIETGTRPPAIETTAPTTALPPRSKWFDMRGGAAPDLRLGGGFRDDLDHAPAGTPAMQVDVESSGQLDPAGGGTYKSNQGVFSAKIAQDGSVTMKDGKNFRIGMALPKPKDLGRGVATWYESDKGADGKRGDTSTGKLVKVSGSSAAPGEGVAVVVPVLGGGFDVTDWLMRSKQGADPYSSRKLAFLDSTRDERVQIGTRHRERQLAQTSQIVQKNLDRLWAGVVDPAARKQALFEMWDEIVETGEPKIVEAGVAARKQIVGFIRARLPSGGDAAYTTDELASFNRSRQSTAAFAPYE